MALYKKHHTAKRIRNVVVILSGENKFIVTIQEKLVKKALSKVFKNTDFLRFISVVS